MKKLLALCLAAAMTATLFAGCGSSATESGSTGGSGTEAGDTTVVENGDGTYTLVCSNKTEPGNYGPYGSGGARIPYNNVLYETLVYLNADQEFQNVMISGYEEVSDSVYDVALYDYIHDTEGNAISASDVVFSYQKATENGSYASVLACLADIEAVDDYTVRFTLENETHNSFLTMLTSINIISEAAWEASGDDMAHNAVGTSPYRLTEYQEGSYVLFEKTNDYWQTDESLMTDRGLAYPDTIRWVVIADSSAAAIALESGEIDHSMVIDTVDLPLFVNDDMSAVDGYAVAQRENNILYGVVFNCSEASECSDVNLRKAICTAIDIEALTTNVLGAYGRPVGNMLSPAFIDCDESMEHLDSYFPYSAEEAASLVEASDYDGSEITMLVGGNANLRAAAVLIEAYLEAVGINCAIEEYETATFDSIRYSADDTAWDFCLVNEQPSSAAGDLWSVLYFADNTLYDFGNLQHFEDATYQELYEAMCDKNTHSAETVQAFLDYTEENCYMYGLFCQYKISIGGGDVISIGVDASGNINCGGTQIKAD
ncbi:MAG: ABC transporter substrate-binding protein [Oscillospiraceae bacterium]|nr:ABC transporter substrate-binding protein [Oscillospiraceae bacterium]